ncbi:MAG: folate-binding protein YgfZ [Rhodospirillales bacterium]|nr:folate-binding protein YgfZ [Rhodospirillales bacterium]
MSEPCISILPDRGVIAVSGEDARSFLQGIVSNDTEKVTSEQAGYGAFLTPQGKYLFDFFMAECGGLIFIETERARIPDFIKRLSLYKLRAKVALEDVSPLYCVAAAYGPDVLDAFALLSEPGACVDFNSGIAFTDPRLIGAGARLIVPVAKADALTDLPAFQQTATGAYDLHRIKLGLPNSTNDLIVDKSVLLENGFDELNGVDWNKGCYMGQEVTARTKHRGLVKKRLLPVSIDGTTPEPGTPIMADDREAGEMRSSCDGMGLALIRLDYLDDQGNPLTPLKVGQTTLIPSWPDWVKI